MNTFIIGFSEECSFPEVVEKLAQDDIIKISQWVVTNKRGTIDLFDFYYGRSFKHRSIKHFAPNHIFQDISKYMFEFCYINSRNTVSHKYVNTVQSNTVIEMHEFMKFVHLIYDIFIEDKIDLVLFQEIPHDGAEAILYRMAEAMKIKTVILANLPHFWGRTLMCYSLNDFGSFNNTPILSEGVQEVKIDRQDLKEKMFYMKYVEGYRTKINILEKTVKKLGNKLFFKALVKLFLSRKKFTNLQLKFSNAIIQRNSILEYQNNIENIIDKNPDLTKRYIYFALHLDPEVQTMPVIAGEYFDQIFAIEKLRAILPDDMFIYVKDNPKQTDIFRPSALFDRLNKLKNVKLVNENTYKLIENSCCVATIAGTVGWEAITGGKNVIMFGKNWYQNFPGIFRFDDIANINEVINHKINLQDVERAATQLLKKTSKGMIYFEFQNPKYSITDVYPEYNRQDNINHLCLSITKMIKNK